MLGAKTAGNLGYTDLVGGFAGAQAEYIRVPIADVNTLKVPSEKELSDDQLLFLSDILPTAWFATELAEVHSGDVVAVWGAGPVGQLACQCAFAKGARRVILVDNVAHRLEHAKKVMPKLETVDFTQDRMSIAGEKTVLAMCKNEPAGGPDCCIECVGVHYAHSFFHKLQMACGLETDTPEGTSLEELATALTQ